MGQAENICVIGGGAAGISAASMAKRSNPDANVIICTEFEDVAYSPCGIPYVLAGEIPEFQRLFLAGPENYVESGVDLRRETEVTAIDATNRTMTANGDVLPWDKLIICSGFNYELPNLPAGMYTLIGWHERVGERSVTVRVEAGRTAMVDLTVPVEDLP